MQGRAAKFVCLVGAALVGVSIFAPPVYSQTRQGETLSSPDSHETGPGLTAISLGTGEVNGHGSWNEV